MTNGELAEQYRDLRLKVQADNVRKAEHLKQLRDLETH